MRQFETNRVMCRGETDYVPFQIDNSTREKTSGKYIRAIEGTEMAW